MQTTTVLNDKINGTVSSLDLTLGITDRNVLGYLAQFDDEETQSEKALEALKVGVIAIQSARTELFRDRSTESSATKALSLGRSSLSSIQAKASCLA